MIGAHNTLTAYRPIHWWMRPLAFAWKCQNKTIPQLIRCGVTLFDIRVCYKDLRAYGAHGLTTINIPIEQTLRLISDILPNSTVRLILERGGNTEKLMFKSDAAKWCHSYPNIRFIGGNFKPTWQQIISFPNNDIHDNISQYVGSMDNKHRWWAKCCPWLYARIFNKQNFHHVIDNPTKPYFFDFI